MVKSFFYGVLIGIILTSASWFGYGRINTADLFRVIDRANRDLERVEQSVSNFADNFNGYADRMALLGTGSSGVGKEIRGIREDFQSEISDRRSEYGDIQSRFQYFTDGINSVEKATRRSVVVSRDFADILYWYRRRSEEDEKKD